MRDLVRRVMARHEPNMLVAEGFPPAAVMILLYERDGEEHILFQVRSQHVEHHKGEISFPGGAKDLEDESLLITALREVEEEIGVAREHVEVFGRFGDRTTRSRFLMTSFVGAITHPAPYAFQIAGHEVDELLEVPLRHLLDPISIEIAQTESGQEMRSFRFGEHLIYGVTARVLSDFLDIVAAEVAAEIEVALTPEAPRP